MKQLGLIACVQPHFIISDFWAADRLGDARARWTYPFKTLVSEGLIVASGSDCPVEPINPLVGIWAAVARKSFPEERLSIAEALKTYTVNGAYASFDEDKKGIIEVDKLADLTVLSDDLSTMAPDEIRNLAVEMTIVNGKIVYSSNNIK
jgi:predicted amidohydrolase YtcJ